MIKDLVLILSTHNSHVRCYKYQNIEKIQSATLRFIKERYGNQCRVSFVRNRNKLVSTKFDFFPFFVAKKDLAIPVDSFFFSSTVNAAVVLSANFPRSTSPVSKISWSVIFASLGHRSLCRTSVFLWVECLLFRTSLLRASLFACTARNSEDGYTREFRSGTYEAPFSTRSELWWSIPFPLYLHRVLLDVYTCPRYRQRAAEKHDESGCSTKLYRLSMEVRPVGALRRKFKARYMRHDAGENWVRAAVLRGYI